MASQQPGLAMSRFNPKAISTFSLSHFLNDLVTTGMVPALVVLYKQAFQLNYTQSTLIVLVSYLTSSITQPIFGMLTDKKPRVWFYPLGVFLSVSGLALTGIAPSYPWLLLFVAISGFGSGIFHPEASRGTHSFNDSFIPYLYRYRGLNLATAGGIFNFVCHHSLCPLVKGKCPYNEKIRKENSR